MQTPDETKWRIHWAGCFLQNSLVRIILGVWVFGGSKYLRSYQRTLFSPQAIFGGYLAPSAPVPKIPRPVPKAMVGGGGGSLLVEPQDGFGRKEHKVPDEIREHAFDSFASRKSKPSRVEGWRENGLFGSIKKHV